MPLTEVFAALGLRRPGSTAIDVRRCCAPGRPEARSRRAVARRALGARSRSPTRRSCCSAGRGAATRAARGVAREFARAPRHVPVEAAAIDDEPALTGAREAALQRLRDAIVAAAR